MQHAEKKSNDSLTILKNRVFLGGNAGEDIEKLTAPLSLSADIQKKLGDMFYRGPKITYQLAKTIGFQLLLPTLKKLCHHRLQKKDFERLRSLITAKNEATQYMIHHYSNNIERYIALGITGYQEMQNDFPELLAEYTSQFSLRTEDDYAIFLRNQITAGIQNLSKCNIIHWNQKRIPHCDRIYALVNQRYGGFYNPQTHNFYPILNDTTDASTIVTNVIHEGEHYMQYTMAGIDYHNNLTGEKVRCISPLDYEILKKSLPVFTSINAQIKHIIDSDKKQYSSRQSANKILEEAYDACDFFLNKKLWAIYFTSYQEIFARIRQIKQYIHKKGHAIDPSLTPIFLDATDFPPRHDIKDNIKDMQLFIQLLKDIP